MRPHVPGCERSKLTVWREAHFTMIPKAGQKERDKRLKELHSKLLSRAKPGKWGTKV